MKPYARAKRVSSQLQRVLTDILAKKIKDPRLELATVTGVNMSRDLRYARIYYVVNGDEKAREQVSQGFETARGYLKRFLARQLNLRYMPEIRFFYDTSLDNGSRIEKLLSSIEAKHEIDHRPVEE
ncbi:Ribosome-binding factor A [Olavius algarvensis associated proteobacterium Delta 3]|nr:Ribosome-binding factor A [Olavius algarvensis associated proteobacterium Delta 3]